MPPVQALLMLRKLLETEYEEEKEEYRRHSNAEALPRKVKRGDAWFPARMGRNYYNSLTQQAWLRATVLPMTTWSIISSSGVRYASFPCPTR